MTPTVKPASYQQVFPCSCTGLTSQQVKYSYAEGGGETSAEAGTEPSQTCQHHQTQRHQWQQKLAPPQVCTYMHTHRKKGVSVWASQLLRSSFAYLLMHDRRSCPHWRQYIIQHHILVIINALCRGEAKSGAKFQLHASYSF